MFLGDPASDSTDVLLRRRREAGGYWLWAHSLFCLFSEYFKTHPTPSPQPDSSYFSTTCFLHPSLYLCLFCFKIFTWLHQALVAACSIISCGRQDLFLDAACGI